MIAIERTTDEIIIRLPASTKADDIQNILDYLSYRQAIEQIEVAESTIEQLAKEVKKGYWERNKHKFQGLEDSEA